MLIRLQDRKGLINFGMVGYMEIAKEFNGTQELQGYAIHMYFEKRVHETAGMYNSEEKALNVLDAICDLADRHRHEKLRPNECKYTSGEVFQMPLDSEVEE